MTTPTLNIDNVEWISSDDETTSTFAAWGTLQDHNFGDWEIWLMGYGDTPDRAILNLRENAEDAWAHDPHNDPEGAAIYPPDLTVYTYAAIPVTGTLDNTHDFLVI